MKLQVVILANSKKLNGRCVAWLQIEKGGIFFENTWLPRFIRPVMDNEWINIPLEIAKEFQLFDIVEFEWVFKNNSTNPNHIENFLFQSDKIQKKWAYFFTDKELSLIESRLPNDIFGSENSIHCNIFKKRSLLFLPIRNYQFYEDKNKNYRIKFKYFGWNERFKIEYDLPITDPCFNLNKSLWEKLWIVVSLWELFNGKYWKLVASIIDDDQRIYEEAIRQEEYLYKLVEEEYFDDQRRYEELVKQEEYFQKLIEEEYILDDDNQGKSEKDRIWEENWNKNSNIIQGIFSSGEYYENLNEESSLDKENLDSDLTDYTEDGVYILEDFVPYDSSIRTDAYSSRGPLLL